LSYSDEDSTKFGFRDLLNFLYVFCEVIEKHRWEARYDWQMSADAVAVDKWS
jgi:hypothetical protein